MLCQSNPTISSGAVPIVFVFVQMLQHEPHMTKMHTDCQLRNSCKKPFRIDTCYYYTLRQDRSYVLHLEKTPVEWKNESEALLDKTLEIPVRLHV